MTLVDAQFSLAKILRPFSGFEATYAGQDARTAIAFPGTLDADAGTPGFSPYLLAGLEVPYGAKVQLWFPVVSYGGSETVSDPENVDYTYQLHWRVRNVADYRRRRKPYHLGKQSGGAPDPVGTPLGTNPARLLIPSALETVIYQQPEPTDAPAVGNLRATTISVPGDGVEIAVPGLRRPLLPPGAPPPPGGPPAYGEFEQGVADPGFAAEAVQSMFRSYFTIAKGDELIITVVRTDFDVSPTWDFAGVDQGFSNLYGTNVAAPPHPEFPELGVYVWSGSNPS